MTKAQILEIAQDLDLYSFTINDGYLCRTAERLKALAETLEDDDA